MIAQLEVERLIHGRPWLTTISGGHGTGGHVLTNSSETFAHLNGTEPAPYLRMMNSFYTDLRERLTASSGDTLLSEVGAAQSMVEGAITAFRESLFSAKKVPVAAGVLGRTGRQLQKLSQLRPMSYQLAVAVEQFAALSTVVGAGTDGLDELCEWAQGMTHKSSDGIIRLTELDWIAELSKQMLATASELDTELRTAVSRLDNSISLQASLSTHFNQTHQTFKSLPLTNLVRASDELAKITDENFDEIKETLSLVNAWMRDQLPTWQTLNDTMNAQATRVAAAIDSITGVFNVLADKPAAGVQRIMLVTELRQRSSELRKIMGELPPNVVGTKEVIQVVDDVMERFSSVFRILEYAKDAVNSAGAKVQGVTQGALNDFGSIFERRAALTAAASDLQEKSESDVDTLLRATRGVSDALLYAIEDNVIGSGASVREDLLNGPKAGARLQDMLTVTGLVNKTLFHVTRLAESKRPLLDMLQSTSEISTVCARNTSQDVRAPDASGLLSAVDQVHAMLGDVSDDTNSLSEVAKLQQCVAAADCSTSVIVKLMKLRVRLKTLHRSLQGLGGFDSGAAAFAVDLGTKLTFVDAPAAEPLSWERPTNYTATSPRAQFGIAATWAFIMPTNGDVPGSIMPDAVPLADAVARGNCHDLAARTPEGGASAGARGVACGNLLRSNMHEVLFSAQEASSLAKEARVALRFDHINLLMSMQDTFQLAQRDLNAHVLPLVRQMATLGNASSRVTALKDVATQLGANAAAVDGLVTEVRMTAGNPWAYELAGMHPLTHALDSASSRREDLCAPSAQQKVGDPVTGLACTCSALFGADGFDLSGNVWGSFLGDLSTLETDNPKDGSASMTPALEETFAHLLDVSKETSIEKRISSDRSLLTRHKMATDLVPIVESSACLARVLVAAIRQLSVTARQNLAHLMDSRILGVSNTPRPPPCKADHCLETVSFTKGGWYEKFWFPMKYMQFWDLSQKALVDPCSVSGSDKDRLERVFRFTVPGLLSTHALTAHTFLSQYVERQDVVITCPMHTYIQAYAPLGMDKITIPGCPNERRPTILAVADKKGTIQHAHPILDSSGKQLNHSITGLAVDPSQSILWACGKGLHDSKFTIHRFDLRDINNPVNAYAGMKLPLKACGSQVLSDSRLSAANSDRCILSWEPSLKVLFVGTDGGGFAVGYRPEGEYPEPEPVYLDGGKKAAKDALKEAAESYVDCVRRRRHLSETHNLDEQAIDGYHDLWAGTKVGDPHPRDRRRRHRRKLGLQFGDPNLPHCGKGTLILSKVERVIDYKGPGSNRLRVSGFSIFRDIFEDRYFAVTRCNPHKPSDGGGCHMEIYDMPWVECAAANVVPGFFKGRDLELDAPEHGVPPEEADDEPTPLEELIISAVDDYQENQKKKQVKKKAGGKVGTGKKAPKKAKKQSKAKKAVAAGKKLKAAYDKYAESQKVSVGTLIMTFPVPTGVASLAHDSAIDAWPTQGQMFTIASLGMTGEHAAATRGDPAADPEDRIFTFRTPFLVTQAVIDPDKDNVELGIMTKKGFKHIIPPTSLSAKVNDKFSNDKEKKGKNAAAKKKSKGRRLEDDADSTFGSEDGQPAEASTALVGRRLSGEPACLGSKSRLAEDIQIRPVKKPCPPCDTLIEQAENALMAAEIAANKAAEQEGLIGQKYLDKVEEALAPAKEKLEKIKKRMGYTFSVYICAFFCLIEIEGHIDAYLRIDVDLIVNLCMPRQDITITLQPKFSVQVDAGLEASIFPLAKGGISAGGTIIGVMVEPTMFIDMKNDFSISGAYPAPPPDKRSARRFPWPALRRSLFDCVLLRATAIHVCAADTHFCIVAAPLSRA